MKTGYRQQGMTFIGWLLLILIAAAFIMLFIRLFPLYLDSYKLSSILSGYEKNTQLVDMSSSEIVAKLSRQLKTDRVEHIGPENIYVVSAGNYTEIEVDYEVRVDFIGNLDLVVQFKKTAQIEGR